MLKKFLLAALLIVCTSAAAFAAPRDIERHWAGNAINTLINHGITDPYEDGRFNPDHAITKEETAAMLANIILMRENGADVSAEAEDMDFWDVGKACWAYPAIHYLARNKIAAANADGSF